MGHESGIVDQNVDAAKPRDGGGDQVLQIFRPRDVADNVLREAAPGFYLLPHPLKGCRGASADHDLCSGTGKGECDAAPYAVTSARHDGDTISQFLQIDTFDFCHRYLIF